MTTTARNARLVLHGKAASRGDVRAAVQTVRQQGHPIEVCVTWEPGDAARFARQGALGGAEVVIAGGGDGTVNEVVAGLLEAAGDSRSATPLAVLPLGTANDLAHACRIPLDPLGALRLAVSGATAAVDVGRVGERPFMNLATGGFGTQVTVATPNDLKKILGGAAYLLTGVTHFSSIRPAQIRLAGPDLNWEGAALVIGVGNGRQAGGGHQLCPTALLNDGLLDVTVLPHLPGEEVLPALRALLREGLDAVRQSLVTARVPWLQIATDEPLQINLDGEPITDTQFRFEILPQRLQLKLPPDCPLLA